jgi:thioredoxin-related protein
MFLMVGLLGAGWFPAMAHSAFEPVSGLEIKSGEMRSLVPSKKGMAIVFLSITCPCSNSHVKELIKLSREYSDYDFVAIHANQDEELKDAKPYFAEAALPFPVLEDVNLTMAERFKARSTPHVFLLDAEGAVLYRGGVSSSKDCEKAGHLYLREALEDLAKGEKVRTPAGRTLGCFISRKKKS